MEIYFDQPVHIRDTFLYWKIEMLSCRSKVYYSFRTQINGPSDVRVFGADCTPHDRGESWDHMMAITEPLPQWEQDHMELLITDVVEDPDDPENPDPDNPGGDEGIDNFEIQNSKFEINIFPNPTTGILNIQLNTDAFAQSGNHTIIALTLHNAMGQPVATNTITQSHNHTIKIDLAPLPAGVYYLTFKSNETTTRHKIIKVTN
jgi:hypothetical protein